MITIRAATPADARGIAEVHVSSWRTSYRGIVPDARLDELSVDDRAVFWGKLLETMQPPHCCFVALDDQGAIAGFAQAGPAKADESASDGELYAIYLIEAAKRKGTGRELMYRAVNCLRETGFGSICLWVLKDNPARAFYERFGGRITGEKVYPSGGFLLASVGYRWEDIDALLAALRVDR